MGNQTKWLSQVCDPGKDLNYHQPNNIWTKDTLPVTEMFIAFLHLKTIMMVPPDWPQRVDEKNRLLNARWYNLYSVFLWIPTVSLYNL